MMRSAALPSPGLSFGPYPLRAWPPPGARAGAATLHGWVCRAGDSLAAWLAPLRRAHANHALSQWLSQVRTQQQVWAALVGPAHAAALQTLRAQLAASGFSNAHAPLLARALGCVAAAAQRSLGRDPFNVQLTAARAMLAGQLVEMATGEGKTLAAALAAAVAALAGVPVHVLTVNDYLVARDAAQLEPLYASLGLRVGAVLAQSSEVQRRAAYAADLCYATAREVAFDYLRDQLGSTQGGAQGSRLQQRLGLALPRSPEPAQSLPRLSEPMQSLPRLFEPMQSLPRLRGLCMAIVDEADSLLIDEATLPLILAEATDDVAQRAACFQALHLARALRQGEHFVIDPLAQQVHWRPAAEAHIEQLAAGLGGAWLNRRHRRDLLGQALTALHLLHHEQHYLVRDGAVQLLDTATGRTALGRQWQRGLHRLVELKEGCRVTPQATTRAQTSVQAFFGRDLLLAGMSGTLRECRAELRASYGRALYPVPLRLPLRRQTLAPRLFASNALRQQAMVQRAALLHAQGRPVLLGTASVAASRALAAALAAAGMPHCVLDARHDGDEAAVVAAAGAPGALTVATQMAGRGTDILLGPGVAAAGGLHVINAQDNPNARLDRQICGRAGRQGEPGSAETWHALDSPAWPRGALARGFARALGAWCARPGTTRWLAPTATRWWAACLQARIEGGQRQLRRQLLEQELLWQRDLSFNNLRA